MTTLNPAPRVRATYRFAREVAHQADTTSRRAVAIMVSGAIFAVAGFLSGVFAGIALDSAGALARADWRGLAAGAITFLDDVLASTLMGLGFSVADFADVPISESGAVIVGAISLVLTAAVGSTLFTVLVGIVLRIVAVAWPKVPGVRRALDSTHPMVASLAVGDLVRVTWTAPAELDDYAEQMVGHPGARYVVEGVVDTFGVHGDRWIGDFWLDPQLRGGEHVEVLRNAPLIADPIAGHLPVREDAPTSAT